MFCIHDIKKLEIVSLIAQRVLHTINVQGQDLLSEWMLRIRNVQFLLDRQVVSFGGVNSQLLAVRTHRFLITEYSDTAIGS